VGRLPRRHRRSDGDGYPMTETRKHADDLVADYLARVRQAAAALPPGRREELIEDLRQHIAAARAELPRETEADVRTLLDRVGDPAAIVAEAMVGEPPPLAPPPVQAPPPPGNRVLTTVLVVVGVVLGIPILLCVLGFALFGTFGQHEPVQNQPVEVSHIPPPSSRS
jgi:HAAS domain-containing protein